MRTPRLYRGNLIAVDWCDAFFSEGWTTHEAVEEKLWELLPGMPSKTTGYFCGKRNGKLALAMSKGSGKDEWGEIYIIPTSCIMKIEVLKK